MKKFTTLVISVFVFGFAFGQEIEWDKTIGGSGNDWLYSIQQTNDGGYILGGKSTSNISGDKTGNCKGGFDYWIVKTDSSGNIQWENTIGGNDDDVLVFIEQTSDSGYILGGTSQSDISGDKTEDNWDNTGITEDYWIVKTNASGNIQWQNTIGGSSFDKLSSIHQTIDNGYILVGYSQSNISGDKTESGEGYWMIKTDILGNIQWQNTIGGNGGDYPFALEETSDGGYIIGGSSTSDISGDKTENGCGGSNKEDYWIVKTDSSGNIQWDKTIGGTDMDQPESIEQTNDGGYIIGGKSWSNISCNKTENCIGGFDYWAVQIDSIGNIQWQNTIGGSGVEGLHSIRQTNDGGYILGGESNSDISGDKTENTYGSPNSNNQDFWIIKTNDLGDIQWQKAIGGYDNDYLRSLQQTSDGDYILGGYSWSNISEYKTENCKGLSDYWIVKLTDNYNSITGKTFLDFNNNQIKDSTDLFLDRQLITESNTNRISFSDEDGDYSLSVLDSGNFFVYPAVINNYNAVPISHTVSFTGIKQTDSLNDFAFQPIAGINDLKISVTPLTAFRPGFNASYLLNYKNVGTTTLTASIMLYLDDSNYTYLSASVAPSLITIDSIQWTNITLTPWQQGSITVTVHVNAGVPIGTYLGSLCIINPIAGDNFTRDNYASWNVQVTGSFDPNDKLVSDTLFSAIQLGDSSLDYIIRFQNTGNDTAFNVRVLDNISPDLDLTTFQVVASSHPVNMSYKAHSRLMTFAFDNILLADSGTNELASHGFIRYRIKPLSTLTVGDTIKNTAFIYFDFNEPVQTNIVTTIVTPDCNTLASISYSTSNFCYGDPVNATVILSYPSSVAWYVDSVFVSNSQSILMLNLPIGSHQIKLTATNVYCTQDVISNITINPLPPKPLISQNLAVLTSSSATGNQWFMNGNIIIGATNNSYTVTLDGWYYVQVTDINGCTNVSDSIYMMVSSVAENQNSDGVKLIPNPTTSSFEVSGLKFEANDEVIITDAFGKIIYQLKISQSTSNLKLQTSNFSEGIYFVNIRTKTQRINLKLIKL